MTTDITDTENRTEEHPVQRGQSFRHWGGTWILVTPTDITDSWIAVNPEANTLAITTITDARWAGETIDDERLLTLVATAWQALQERWERVQARLVEREQMISDIRQYAIDRHLEGAFCCDGLNTFLHHFDLDPYQPRYAVPVTVSATVQISADDADAAQRRVRYLIDGIAYSGDSDEDEIEVTLDDTFVGDPETA